MDNAVYVLASMSLVPPDGRWYRIAELIPATYVKWVADRQQWVRLFSPTIGSPSREYIDPSDWNQYLILNDLITNSTKDLHND